MNVRAVSPRVARRPQRANKRSVSRVARRFAAAVMLAALGGLIALNLAVRELGGGEPALLSPAFVPEKARAVGGLLLHYARHVVARCEPEPERVLIAAARREGLPPDFVLGIASAESDHQPHRISHAGAMGLMQLMPGTAAELGVVDPFDPEQSARAGARHLRRLWKRYGGDRARVAAAYNAGPGWVSRRGPLTLPGETKRYIVRVRERARLYAALRPRG